VKDQTTLLEAFGRVRARVTRVHLDIVGEDTLEGAMPQLARRLGVEDAVTFHGFKPSDEIVGFYQRAHVFVLSSRHEASGIVILEAAACGLAAAGTAVGHIADWTPDLALGVPPRDPDALAAAIVSLLEDPIRRALMADAARAWTLAHDADWTAERFEELYGELAGRSLG